MDYSPPRIIHGAGKPCNMKLLRQIINDVSKNAKLTGKQSQLLFFYAKHKTSFSPAKKLVLKNTPISERRLSEVRNKLQSMGLIEYRYTEDDHFIFINWTIIRGLAMLETPLTVGGRSHDYFCTIDHALFQGHPDNTENRQLKVSIGSLQSNPPATWAKYGIDSKKWDNWKRNLQCIGRLTESNYRQMVEGLMTALQTERKIPAMTKAEEKKEKLAYSSPPARPPIFPWGEYSDRLLAWAKSIRKPLENKPLPFFQRIETLFEKSGVLRILGRVQK